MYLIVGDRFTEYAGFSAVGVNDAQNDFDEGRFPGAVWTQQAKNLTLFHGKAEVLQRFYFSPRVKLTQMLCFDGKQKCSLG